MDLSRVLKWCLRQQLSCLATDTCSPTSDLRCGLERSAHDWLACGQCFPAWNVHPCNTPCLAGWRVSVAWTQSLCHNHRGWLAEVRCPHSWFSALLQLPVSFRNRSCSHWDRFEISGGQGAWTLCDDLQSCISLDLWPLPASYCVNAQFWAILVKDTRTGFMSNLTVRWWETFSKAKFRSSDWSEEIFHKPIPWVALLSQNCKCSLGNNKNPPAPESKLPECDLITHVDISKKQIFANWRRAFTHSVFHLIQQCTKAAPSNFRSIYRIQMYQWKNKCTQCLIHCSKGISWFYKSEFSVY